MSNRLNSHLAAKTPFDTPRGRLTRVGGWRLGRTLGRGAYAHVRIAIHIATGHQAACKILPSLHAVPGHRVSWDETLDAVEAHKEVVLLKALAGARMPHVVELEGVMEEGGWTYVFLKLYPYTLSSLPLPVDLNIFIPLFRELLKTVSSLHALGISHEDLKRPNVLVDGNGNPSIADFGFSHFIPCGGRVQSMGGTIDYSSPEKAADKMYRPWPNDVWALGIILVKMLQIPHPYMTTNGEAETAEGMKSRILIERPNWIWNEKSVDDDGYEKLIMGMLDRDPHDRLTIAEILSHPFMQSDYDDPDPFRIPPMRLTSKVSQPVSAAVLMDVLFLAYVNNQFFLCETSKKIEKRLYGRVPCWEQRWASMLGGWEQRSEMDWKDELPPITERLVKSLPTRIPRRISVLKEIHLSPVPTVKPTPLPPRATQVLSVLSPQKENIPVTPRNQIKSLIKGMQGRSSSLLATTPSIVRKEAPPLAPRKSIAVTRTVIAAVALEPRKVLGPSAFGRARRVKAVTRAKASIHVHAALSNNSIKQEILSESESPSSVNGSVVRWRMGKPIRTFPFLKGPSAPKNATPGLTSDEREHS